VFEKIIPETEDEQFMRIALSEAVKGVGFTSPNPLVGAVAVKDKKVLGTAYHQRFGDVHAEVALLSSLTADEIRGSTVYVNLEPCCHYGKTAPCTDALVKAGVKRVVISHEDPNPLVKGKGIQQLRDAGIEIQVGVLESEARRMNAPFITFMTHARPWILLKVAQSLDGRIALSNGKSRWITGEDARKEVHRLRAELDAVMVGSQTIIDDNPELTVRHITGRDPLRVVVDSTLRISTESKILKQMDRTRTWILTTEHASIADQRRIEATGAVVMICPSAADSRIDLKAAMEILAQHGLTSVFVEGGGTLHASFIKAGLYDKFIVAIAPMLIGSDGRPAIWELGITEMEQIPRFDVYQSRKIGEDIWLEMERHVYGNS
jgi:diaminohydroxyphosphoribosylaminopyrimidine deaminase / 5-amino-6-(5-phosphoribosylamino)uracil reductase